MTGELFRQWMHQVNNLMVHQQRHILMFVDNCSAHPDIQMSNIKLVFLPPNTTSRLQPCDAGIIKAVKGNYRKRLLRHLLLKMNEVSSVTDLVKEVTVLDAILWMRNAWDATSPTTIQKCFAKCGFNTNTTSAVDSSQDEDDTSDLNPVLAGMTWEDFVDADADVATSNTADDNWEQDLIEAARGRKTNTQTPETDSDSDCDQAEERPAVISHETALEYLSALQTYALHHSDSDMVDRLSKTMDHCVRRRMLNLPTLRQRTISDFFSTH